MDYDKERRNRERYQAQQHKDQVFQQQQQNRRDRQKADADRLDAQTARTIDFLEEQGRRNRASGLPFTPDSPAAPFTGAPPPPRGIPTASGSPSQSGGRLAVIFLLVVSFTVTGLIVPPSLKDSAVGIGILWVVVSLGLFLLWKIRKIVFWVALAGVACYYASQHL